MSSIEHRSSTTVTVSSKECESLSRISETKIAEIGATVLDRVQTDCAVSTWLNYKACALGRGRRQEAYPCDMTLAIDGDQTGTTAITFNCSKALCKGGDATVNAGEIVQKKIERAVDAIDKP
jgi:hypothetical protein